MAALTNTVEYGWDSNSTVILTAAPYTTPDKTIVIAETGKTFTNASVLVYVQDGQATRVNYTSYTIDVTIDGNTASTGTVTTTFGGGNEHQCIMIEDNLNFASHFNTFFTGSAHTVSVSVTVAGPSTVGHNVKLLLTYEYDDEDLLVGTKTVRIPIESQNTATLTNTLTALAGLSNNVPALDSFCAEDSKTFHNVFFEVHGNDATPGTTTNFNLQLALNGEAASNRWTIFTNLQSARYFRDIWERNDLSASTSAATTHTLLASSSLTTRFTGVGAILHATYTYDYRSPRITNSIVYTAVDSDSYIPSTTASDAEVFNRQFLINEPGTIIPKQSGALYCMSGAGSITLNLSVGTQTARTFTLTAGGTQTGQYTAIGNFIENSTAGSGLTFTNGYNSYVLRFYATVVAAGGALSAIGFLNYESDNPFLRAGRASHSFYKTVKRSNANTATAFNDTYNLSFTSDTYYLKAAILNYTRHTVSTLVAQALYYRYLAGEGPAATVSSKQLFISVAPQDNNAYGINTQYARARDDFKRFSFDNIDSDRVDAKLSRVYRFVSNTSSKINANAYLSTSDFYYDLNASVLNFSGTGNDIIIKAYSTHNNELLFTGVTTGGTYSNIWFDNNVPLFLVAEENGNLAVSEEFTVSGNTFTIDLNPSGSSTTITKPIAYSFFN